MDLDDFQVSNESAASPPPAEPDLGELGPENGEDAYASDDEDFGFADL